MNTHVVFVATLAVLARSLLAVEIQKADNTLPLNEGPSWEGGAAPGPQDKAVFFAAPEDRAVAFGAAAAWNGITVADSANVWTLAGPAGLTLGAGGILADGNLTLAGTAGVTLAASQSWNVSAPQRALRVDAPIQGAASATLTKLGVGTLVLPCDNPFEGTLLLGNAATGNISTNPLAATAGSSGFIAIGHGGALGRGQLRCRGAQILADVPGLVIPNDGIFEGGSLRVGGTNDITFSGTFTPSAADRDIGNYTTAGNTLTLAGTINTDGRKISLRSISGLQNMIALNGPLLGTGLLLLATDFAGSTAWVTGDNTAFAGSSEINGGTLVIPRPEALGPNEVKVNGDNTTFALAADMVFTNAVTVGTAGVGMKRVRTMNGASVELAGPFVVNETDNEKFQFQADAGETLTVSGPITCTAGAGITKVGTGVLVLPNPNPQWTDKFVAGTGSANQSPTWEGTANSGGRVVVGHSGTFGGSVQIVAKGSQFCASADGLVVTNPVSIVGGGLRFGGDHDLTFSGDIIMDTSRDLANYSRNRALVLTGAITVPTNQTVGCTGIADASANGTIAVLGPVAGEGGFDIDEEYDNGLVILGGANTFTQATTLHDGTLRLDYTAQDNSKLSDAAPLYLNGANIELAGGTHLEQVGETVVSEPARITRLDGTAVLALGALTVARGGALHLAAPGIASTTSPNINGLLPGVTVTRADGTDAPAAVSDVPDGAGGRFIAAADLPFDPSDDIPHLGGILPDDPAFHARVVDGGYGAAVTPAALSNRVSTLTVTAAESPTVLALAPDGLLTVSAVTLAAGAADFALGGSDGAGLVTSGAEGSAAPASLALINHSPGATLTVNAAIHNKTVALVTTNGADIATNTTVNAVTLVKRGPGPVVFTGTNLFSGGLSVEEGTLQIGNGGARATWGTTFPTAVRNNGTLVWDVGAGPDEMVTASIVGTGRVVKNGAFQLRLRGSGNRFTGGLEINGGTLRGEDTVSDDLFLQLGSGPVALNGAKLGVYSRGAGNNGVIVTGDGYTPSDLSVSGAATLEVNRYDTAGNRSGNTVLFGSLTLAAGTVFSHVAANAYSAAFAGPVTLLGNVTFAPTATDIQSELRFDGPVGDGGQGFGFSRTTTDKGVLALNGDNTFSGPVSLGAGAAVIYDPIPPSSLNVNGGIVIVGHSHAFGSGPLVLKGAQIRASRPGLVIANDITIDSGGFRFGGTNDLTFAGDIRPVTAARAIGNTTLCKTLTLTGSLITAGTTYGFNFEGKAGSPSNGTTVVAGVISGAAPVQLNSLDNGLVVFANDMIYTGKTDIFVGNTLQLGNGGTNGSCVSSVPFNVNGTLAFNRSDAITQGVHFASAWTGNGGVSQRGAGRVVFTAANAYTGATHIAAGAVLELAAGGSLNAKSPVLADGALAFGWPDGRVFTNAVSGAGCLALEGGGAVALSGDLSAFTGTVRVCSNAVIAAGASVLPALTFDPGAAYRWNVSGTTQDVLAVAGDLALPASGFTLDIRRAEGEHPNLRGRTLFTYGGVYTGPDEAPAGAAYVAVHDAAAKTLRLKPVSEGTLLLVQ